MSLDLQNAQVGVTLAITIFDEFFLELHKNDPGLQNIPVFGDIALQIDELRFLLNNDHTDTILRIVGVFGVTEITINIRLSLILKPVESNPPVLGLVYNGVDSIEADNLAALEDSITNVIDERFTDESEGSIRNRIDAVEIDVISKAIEGLEVIIFPEEANRPSRDFWNSQLQILPADGDITMDAIAIFIAAPGIGAETNLESSFLHAKTGLGIIFNRTFLQDVFDRGAEERIGSSQCGATIESLSLTIEDDHIQINGQVQKSIVEIPFDGPAFPFLYRGTTEMSLDASQVDADEPGGLAGFLKFLSILTAIILPLIGGVIFGLLGIIGGIVADVWVVPGLWGAAEDLDHADESIQGGLGGALGAQLSELAQGLTIEEDIEMVSLESTPNELTVIDGHFLFDALIFVSPIEQTITNGWFTKRHSRFVLHELEGGQKFKTSELSRLVKIGKITTPGFHPVTHQNGRCFMRANPDDEAANNLFDTFRDNLPDEPFPIHVEEGEEDSDDC